jgi:kynureninase
MITLDHCLALDAVDPLAGFREAFERAPGERIYLDGNSMGAMPRAVPARIARALLDEWSTERRHAWHSADWLDAPQRIGAAFAPLLGAAPEELIAVDNTTLNLHKLLVYGLSLVANEPQRSTIIYESDGFPTDAHVVQGVVHQGAGRWRARPIASQAEFFNAMGTHVAMVVLSHADYRSSERWDMARVNALAHASGARVLWDLSHTAGVVPVELNAHRADFAVACSYKYLSCGPGAPALAFIRRDLQTRAWPAIPGWLGHADRMNFVNDYQPAPGMMSLITGTMPVLQDAVADCAAQIWARVDPAQVFAKHWSLSGLLGQLLREQCAAFGVEPVSPLDHDRHGGHVAFRCPGGGATCEALLASGVVGSFRQPDVIRFGLAPLTVSHADLWHAVARLRDILREQRWRESRFQEVSV